MLDGLRRFFGRAPVGSATLAVRGEVVGLDRPDERRVLTPRARSWSSSRTRDEARNKDVAVVDAILRETSEGRVSRFVDLCSSSRDRDSRLDAVCRTRILAIQGRPFVVRPPPGYEGDRAANENALWITQHLSNTRGFANLIGHLAHGTLYGHAVLEHDWRYEGGEWRTQPRFVHGNRVGWNTDTEQAGFYESGLFSGNLVPFDRYPSKFILHNPVGGRSSYPWGRGALRSRVIASILKRMGIAWWVKMLERWGQPQVFVTRPPSLGGTPGPDGADEDDDIIAGLRKLSDDWRAVIPNGASIETIAANVHPELHEKFVALQNLEDAVAILGQNLSTEVQGGSYAAARAHQLVRFDVLAADLAELTETITDQWIRLLVEFNRPGTPVPYIDWILAPRGEITVAHFQAGLYSADEVRQSMGHDPETENTGARYAKAEGASASTSSVDVAGLLKAIEVARGVGLQPTPGSVSTVLAGLGLTMQAIPGGTTQPKAITLAPTDIAKVVLVSEARASQGLPPFGDERDAMTISELDAKIAAEAESAKLAAAAEAEMAANPPPPPDPALAGGTPPPPSTTEIVVGAVWTDTRDGHRLEVKRVEDGKVYLVDLDAPNAAGQLEQFAWNESVFRERCSPPTP